jgi:hypothetical protein
MKIQLNLILTLVSLTLSLPALAQVTPLVRVERENAREGGARSGCTLYRDGRTTMTRDGEIYGPPRMWVAIKKSEVRPESFQGLVDAGLLYPSDKYPDLYWPNRDKLGALISEADQKSPAYKVERKNLLRGRVQYVGYAGATPIRIKYEWTEDRVGKDGKPELVTFGEYRHGDNIAQLIDVADAACRAGLRKAVKQRSR